MSNLAAHGKASEFRNRERRRAGDHAIEFEAPVRETGFLKPLKRFAQWIHCVRERGFRNLAGSELTRQRVVSQQPLRSIGQCFAGAIEAPRIWRDESITLCNPADYGEPGCTGGDCEAGGDEFSS